MVHVGRFGDRPEPGMPLRVVHVVDAMGGDDALWGKERAVQALMRAQRESGEVLPELACFTPGRLAREMRAEGFRVVCLEDRHRKLPLRALPELARTLSGSDPIVHTHSYKANVLGRLARLSGVRMSALIATCHGWDEKTWRLWLYNRIDRRLSFISDAVTVPDAAMAGVFAHADRIDHIANAAAYRSPATPEERARARERFGFGEDDFVVGFLGRVDEPKGALDLLAAAAQTRKRGITWAIAGTGACETRIRVAGFENVRLLGYLDDTQAYLCALDAYVQVSHREALSLSLLEAMRAGLPSLATRVGSTEFAVRHESEGLLFSPGEVDDLVRHALLLKDSPTLRRRLGDTARRRFEFAFDVKHQHRAFLDLYRTHANKRTALALRGERASEPLRLPG
jgi:glycosyltransferase involved in cell wall biosynthesis